MVQEHKYCKKLITLVSLSHFGTAENFTDHSKNTSNILLHLSASIGCSVLFMLHLICKKHMIFHVGKRVSACM